MLRMFQNTRYICVFVVDRSFQMCMLEIYKIARSANYAHPTKESFLLSTTDFLTRSVLGHAMLWLITFFIFFQGYCIGRNESFRRSTYHRTGGNHAR